MKLKGNWDDETTYAVGDVVKYTDNVVYNLLHPCPAGIPPVDTHYWGRASAMRAMCALMIIDMMEADDEEEQDIIDMIPTNEEIVALIQENLPTIPDNISDDAIVLKSSTAESDKQFLITVDDDGDMTATEIVPEDDEQEGE